MEENKKVINRFDAGMIELRKLITMMKQGYIKKSEYNQKRKEIELNYFDIK